MTTKTKPIEIGKQSDALDIVINDSGLQLTEAEAIKQSYLPYFNEMAEVKEQAIRINFDNPTDIDEKIARELRLKTVKIRKGSEEVKKDRKQIHMLKANLEQAAWNLIKTTCHLDEEIFSKVEKHREILEIQRKDQLAQDRLALLEPFEIVTGHLDLGEMTDDLWDNYYTGVKTTHEQAIKQAEQAEKDRLAQVEATAQKVERINELSGMGMIWIEVLDHYESHGSAVSKDDVLTLSNKEFKKKVSSIATELKKLKKEQQEKDRKAAEIEAKIEAETERIANHVQAEKDRLDKIVQAELEAKQKQLEVKKQAELAPDKDKLTAFAGRINSIEFPIVISEDAQSILHEIRELLTEMASYIVEKTEKL